MGNLHVELLNERGGGRFLGKLKLSLDECRDIVESFAEDVDCGSVVCGRRKGSVKVSIRGSFVLRGFEGTDTYGLG